MKALLDENMPKALIRLLAPEVEAWTVQQQGWSGRKNGNLLAAASESFDVLITTDQGIPNQQNLSRYEIGIILMEARSNRIEDLALLVPEVKARLGSVASGVVLRVPCNPHLHADCGLHRLANLNVGVYFAFNRATASPGVGERPNVTRQTMSRRSARDPDRLATTCAPSASSTSSRVAS